MTSISNKLYDYFHSIYTHISNEYAKFSTDKKIASIAAGVFSLLLFSSCIYGLHRFYQSKKRDPFGQKIDEVVDKVIKAKAKKFETKEPQQDHLEIQEFKTLSSDNELTIQTTTRLFSTDDGGEWDGDFIFEEGQPTGNGKVTYYIPGTKKIKETLSGYFKKGNLNSRITI